MAGAKEFWVPVELALEILGFNRNILEKRINADYIKKEIRGGIEILEISGEIERFGLSEETAREKMDAYINKNGGAPSVNTTEKKREEPEKPKSRNTSFEPSFVPQNAGIPVAPIVLPSSNPTPVAAPAVKVIDHTAQLNKISQVLEDIMKLTKDIPQSVVANTPKEPLLPNPQITDLRHEVNKLATLSEQNQSFQKEVASLHGQLKTANTEITRLNTQSNSVMDELERTTQKHNTEIELLKSTVKTEISSISSLISLKLGKSKGNGLVIFFILILLGAVGFLIFELIQPTFSVLVQPNDKINPITKKDVEESLKVLVEPMEEKLKTNISTLNAQNKDQHQKELTEINSTIVASLETQKDSLKKTIDAYILTQKDSKISLDENYTKSLKAIETQVIDLEKLIKRMLETTVQIKPGEKFIPDSKE